MTCGVVAPKSAGLDPDPSSTLLVICDGSEPHYPQITITREVRYFLWGCLMRRCSRKPHPNPFPFLPLSLEAASHCQNCLWVQPMAPNEEPSEEPGSQKGHGKHLFCLFADRAPSGPTTKFQPEAPPPRRLCPQPSLSSAHQRGPPPASRGHSSLPS